MVSSVTQVDPSTVKIHVMTISLYNILVGTSVGTFEYNKWYVLYLSNT